jgi:hypothetical protein
MGGLFMDAVQALATIRSYAVAGRLIIVKHAFGQMKKRNISHEDVRQALANAKTCKAQDGDRWKACGRDCSGDDLDVVVVIEASLIIVTVF